MLNAEACCAYRASLLQADEPFATLSWTGEATLGVDWS
jgi:hypothetical protein